jgi:DNA-directed RNA polymerase subunit F
MVNVDRVKKKIPSLLCRGSTSERKNNNAFMRNRYRLQQFVKQNPERFSTLINELVSVLEKIENEVKTIF